MGEGAIFGASAISQAGNAYAQNQALKGESDFERRMTNVNSGWAQMSAENAIQRGDFQAGQVNRYGEQVKGAQRTGFAKQGVDVNQGSAAQVQSETETLSALDVLAARNNAFKEYMGIKSQDAEMQGKAKMNRLARKSAGRQSIIQAGGAIARQGLVAKYRYDNRTKNGGGSHGPSERYDPYEDP
jgi:hypothetical protein